MGQNLHGSASTTAAILSSPANAGQKSHNDSQQNPTIKLRAKQLVRQWQDRHYTKLTKALNSAVHSNGNTFFNAESNCAHRRISFQLPH
jgi:hypothetical protein